MLSTSPVVLSCYSSVASFPFPNLHRSDPSDHRSPGSADRLRGLGHRSPGAVKTPVKPTGRWRKDRKNAPDGVWRGMEGNDGVWRAMMERPRWVGFQRPWGQGVVYVDFFRELCLLRSPGIKMDRNMQTIRGKRKHCSVLQDFGVCVGLR